MPAPYQYYQKPSGEFFRQRTKLSPLPEGHKYFGEHTTGKEAWNKAKAEFAKQNQPKKFYYRNKNGYLVELNKQPKELPEGASFLGEDKRKAKQLLNEQNLYAKGEAELAGEPTGFGKLHNWLKSVGKGASEFAFGVSPQQLKFEQLDPKQKLLLQNQLLPYIENLINQEKNPNALEQYSKGFDPYEQRAMRQFREEVIPSISERFNVLSGGQGRSGAFAQILGQAGNQLQENLATQRAQFGQQQQEAARRQLLGSLGYGLGHNIENAYIPRQPGFLENIAVGGAQGLAKAGGMAAMGSFL